MKSVESEEEDFIQKINAVLTELKPLDKVEDFGTVLIGRVVDPPSYMAQIALGGGGKFPMLRREDKSRWQIQLSFRGAKFQITDWKGYAISIEGQDDSVELRGLATVLLKKIRIAATILDKELQPHLKAAAETSDFYLINSLHKARFLYEQFREDLRQAMSSPDSHVEDGVTVDDDAERPKGIIVELDRAGSDWLSRLMHLNRKVAHYGCAAVTFYFAYLDVVMNIVYPFLDKPSAEFVDFRSKDWHERFKEIFPVAEDQSLKEVYDKLLDLRRRIRNVVVHGYSGDEGILVPLGRFGLVPATYTSLLTAPQYGFFAMDPDEAKSALDLFDRMDSWLESSDPYRYVLRYADSSWEIPFGPDKIESIKSEMTTMEEFQEFLQEKARADDYWAEQYW